MGDVKVSRIGSNWPLVPSTTKAEPSHEGCCHLCLSVCAGVVGVDSDEVGWRGRVCHTAEMMRVVHGI